MTSVNRLTFILILMVSTQVVAKEDHFYKKGKLVKSLRMLTYNVYGKKEKSCNDRFRTIGKNIRDAYPKYDIVSLNEHYNPWVKLWFSCDGKKLTKALQKEGEYKDKNGKVKNHKHYPKGSFLQANGANSLFTTHSIEKFKWWKFKNGRKIIANGFMLNRVVINEDLKIDVWTVHMESKGPDKCSDQCRLRQFHQLVDTIEKYNEGNVTIIMGDFNVGGPFSLSHRESHALDSETFPYPGNGGYEDMMAYLEYPIDAWLAANPKGKRDGYTFDCRNNTTIKSRCSYQERIDYIIIPTSERFQTADYIIEVDKSSTAKWKTKKGVDVSDHYGVEASISVYEKVPYFLVD